MLLPIIPEAGLFQANSRTAYSDVREWRKNTFTETEKAFLSTPPGGCENLPKDKGGKGESVGKPTLSTGCMPVLCFGTVLMVRVIHLSGLQWIDSSDRGRSSKDERWQ